MTKEEYIDTNEYGYDADKGIWSKAKEKFLEGTINSNGYVQVGLRCVDGKNRTFYYHRALWFLAYGSIPEGYQINHIREFEKTDNRLCNLELVTPKENINYGTRNERCAVKLRGVPRPYMIERNKRLRSKPVVAVDKDGNVIYEFLSAKEAERQGFRQSAVSACCNNCYHRQGNNIYKNLRWYFKDEWEKLVWEKEQAVKRV